MSRNQAPRTPEYFPNMKHRAVGRKIRNSLAGTFPYLLSELGYTAEQAAYALVKLRLAVADVAPLVVIVPVVTQKSEAAL